MALNYPNFRNLAERLIEENGRIITLIRKDQGNPADPAKPWRASTQAAEITTDVLGVFVDFDKEDIDGQIIKRGDKRVLVAAKSVEDETTGSVNIKIEDYDSIFDGSVRWKVIMVDVVEPGSLRILYSLQVRQ